MLATCFKICKNVSYFKVSFSNSVAFPLSIIIILMYCIQGVKIENGTCDSEDDSMMETDATDKQACFVLFQKFVREVSFNSACCFKLIP